MFNTQILDGVCNYDFDMSNLKIVEVEYWRISTKYTDTHW